MGDLVDNILSCRSSISGTLVGKERLSALAEALPIPFIVAFGTVVTIPTRRAY